MIGVLHISDHVRNFCIELFQFKLGDQQLNALQDYFYGWPLEIREPLRLVISSEHLNIGTDQDFQLQLSITEKQFDLWCSVFSLKAQLGHSFFYHYYEGEAEVLEGNMNAVSMWLNEQVKRKGDMLGYLKIEHNIELED